MTLVLERSAAASTSARAMRPKVLWRAALVAAPLVAAAAALALLPVRVPAEADLARLLRGMAAIKAALALAAGAVAWWRLGRPVSAPVGAVYVAAVAAMAWVSAALWQYAALGWGSIVFHAALLGGAVVAARDGMGRVRRPT